APGELDNPVGTPGSAARRYEKRTVAPYRSHKIEEPVDKASQEYLASSALDAGVKARTPRKRERQSGRFAENPDYRSFSIGEPSRSTVQTANAKIRSAYEAQLSPSQSSKRAKLLTKQSDGLRGKPSFQVIERAMKQLQLRLMHRSTRSQNCIPDLPQGSSAPVGSAGASDSPPSSNNTASPSTMGDADVAPSGASGSTGAPTGTLIRPQSPPAASKDVNSSTPSPEHSQTSTDLAGSPPNLSLSRPTVSTAAGSAPAGPFAPTAATGLARLPRPSTPDLSGTGSIPNITAPHALAGVVASSVLPQKTLAPRGDGFILAPGVNDLHMPVRGIPAPGDSSTRLVPANSIRPDPLGAGFGMGGTSSFDTDQGSGPALASGSQQPWSRAAVPSHVLDSPARRKLPSPIPFNGLSATARTFPPPPMVLGTGNPSVEIDRGLPDPFPYLPPGTDLGRGSRSGGSSASGLLGMLSTTAESVSMELRNGWRSWIPIGWFASRYNNQLRYSARNDTLHLRESGGQVSVHRGAQGFPFIPIEDLTRHDWGEISVNFPQALREHLVPRIPGNRDTTGHPQALGLAVLIEDFFTAVRQHPTFDLQFETWKDYVDTALRFWHCNPGQAINISIIDELVFMELRLTRIDRAAAAAAAAAAASNSWHDSRPPMRHSHSFSGEGARSSFRGAASGLARSYSRDSFRDQPQTSFRDRSREQFQDSGYRRGGYGGRSRTNDSSKPI
ncbi:hypothetical protein EV361DRAFT_1015721, partial [Lentinula raphanica]